MPTIRNPIEWGTQQVKSATAHVEESGRTIGGRASKPSVRRIGVDDLRDALAKGVADFAACRTDVIFLCIVYPIAGLVLARLVFEYDLVRMLFPLASGFALLGPIAAVGLYEMSRHREAGQQTGWGDALGVMRSPRLGAILTLGVILLAIFLAWLAAAEWVYAVTLGPAAPASLGGFFEQVFTTAAGWTMIGVGIGIGFLFALLVLAISVVSFPLLLDRDVGVGAAIAASFRAVIENPAPMAVWGLIVAAGLVVGSLPLFLGLAVVLPILGHATWHLYRKVIDG